MMKEISRVTSGKNCVGAMQISTNAGDKLCITPTAAMQISTNQFLTTVATFFPTRGKTFTRFSS